VQVLLRTGGGPPGVLFYKRFFFSSFFSYSFSFLLFLKFIFKPKPLFFADPHRKFLVMSYSWFFKFFFLVSEKKKKCRLFGKYFKFYVKTNK